MNKVILITGSTDGIGLATAKSLLELGHTVLLHGRSEAKLASAKQQLSGVANTNKIYTYKADLSVMADVKALASAIKENHQTLDTLINNAGVFVVPEKLTPNGFDVRFMVNTIAPYLLTKLLLPLLRNTSRVINLSSAAQASVTGDEITKPSVLSDSAVYAKSKLALTMWSRQLALLIGDDGPIIIAVNPKSFLGSKMVEQAYGVAGGNLQQGADILVRATLSDEFANASGLYFDNDIGQFTAPHPDAVNADKIQKITQALALFTGL
ncbi:SDR family NAD(P)-dependent oxidoreductase [Pseudoalteromonas sp. MMG010]|uniref:SDR family NAD(P)-dependent oxidoreductase n=1 Tax=Pseudoalteromonas sp. MMG010 TaxID=2822685 RepID=UPI001B39E9F4|nr:SDR family NAD(P)-dependent oxidoreductase [Pseudoalteromonas sp. MMG010]MBQ4832122.1 SDR family NAD(P)-dependent oxidoreductase [Pseudoalteromonas sp. MMG010]